jgi:LemA protein
MKWLIPIGVIFAIVVGIFAIFGGTYNSLVQKSEDVSTQWAQVESQYQRRLDLVPNLVETVKGFFAQEQAIFDSITSARSAYSGAQSTQERVAAANELETSLSRLLVIVEQNPEIRSNESVARLMDELAGTENRVNVARTRYNDSVRDYNTSVKSFPNNLIAGMFGFGEREYFEAVEGAEVAPTVNFDTND